MKRDDRRSQGSSRGRTERVPGEGRYAQQGQSRQSYARYESAGERYGQQSRGVQSQPDQRRSRPRRPARDWPDRLEVERRERERKELERRKQLRLQRRRKAKIRRRLQLCTITLFGVVLFLSVKLMTSLDMLPEKKEKKEEKVDIEKLAEEGDYPESLLKLLDKNPETKDFVLNYPKNKDKHVDIDVSKEVAKGKIPLFLQWDERWGYETYGDDFLALTGCGPTCLSMVLCGLSGDSTWNPYKTARMAENGGYYVSGAGSAWDLMTQGAEELGLTVQEIIFDEEHITSTLEAGTPIICVVGAGDFTDSGHFLVLTGIDEEGKITLNDPNSKIRSKETWDIEHLMGQIKNLWAYSYDGGETK